MILFSINTEEIPEVEHDKRVTTEALPQGFHRVRAYYGFMERPDVQEIVTICRNLGLDVGAAETTYYLGRAELLSTGPAPMTRWRKRLFSLRSRNAGAATDFFRVLRVGAADASPFDPNDVQFGDALVSSAVVFLRKAKTPMFHRIEFTFGGTLQTPRVSASVPVGSVLGESKWTRFPALPRPDRPSGYRLSDFFTIKRGLATGDNDFFILTADEVQDLGLPREYLRPVLPSPRFVQRDEILADEAGNPLLDRRLFLLDCRLPEEEVERLYPTLWAYLQTDRGRQVRQRYLCIHRSPWYAQEDRPSSMFVCTYMGRGDGKGRKAFRFLLNHSKATATNVYLILYPRPRLARILGANSDLARKVWEVLNEISLDTMVGEGRVYGGGLHKLEPKELGNVPADDLARLVAGEGPHPPVQLPFPGAE